MSIFYNFSLKDKSERIERRDETRTQWALNVTHVYGKLAKIQFSKVNYLQIKKIVQVPGYPTFFWKNTRSTSRNFLGLSDKARKHSSNVYT